MSEFKYACPVCGQHMKCDSSQSGSVSECPTCFQKIVVPQPPATDDPKFILTGAKYTEKKVAPSLLAAAEAANREASAPEKPFPMTVVVALAVVLAAGALALVFRGKLFKQTPPPKPIAVTNTAPKPKPVLAPRASDTNWMLALDTATIPNGTAVGRIHGQDFIVEKAIFQNGVLTLREGAKGPVESGVQVNFSGVQAETLAGHSLNITTNVDKAVRVILRWKEGGELGRAGFDADYAMRLEFGPLANNRLSGKIYLCTPDAEKSYLMGAFNAAVPKPRPQK